jgi:hypothetical protein
MRGERRHPFHGRPPRIPMGREVTIPRPTHQRLDGAVGLGRNYLSWTIFVLSAHRYPNGPQDDGPPFGSRVSLGTIFGGVATWIPVLMAVLILIGWSSFLFHSSLSHDGSAQDPAGVLLFFFAFHWVVETAEHNRRNGPNDLIEPNPNFLSRGAPVPALYRRVRVRPLGTSGTLAISAALLALECQSGAGRTLSGRVQHLR